MRPLTRLALLLAALTATACGSRSEPEPALVPASWTRVDPLPAPDAPEQSCAGVLASDWTLSVSGNTLDARLAPPPAPRRDALPYEIDYTGTLAAPPLPPPTADGRPSLPNTAWAIGYARDHARRVVVSVDDGWLVAFDAGEYGGSVWWYPRQPGSGQKIWDRNVRWLLRRGGDVLAIGGLAHMGGSEGVMLRLTPSKSGWAIAARHSLTGGPQAVAEDPDGRVVIVTTAAVERVQGDATEVLAKADNPLPPSSALVTRGGAIALALRMWVQVLQPQNGGYRSEWYVPRSCKTFAMGEFLCKCTGPDGA